MQQPAISIREYKAFLIGYFTVMLTEVSNNEWEEILTPQTIATEAERRANELLRPLIEGNIVFKK